jgi:negative regulator of flagellin synthesis FlgM
MNTISNITGKYDQTFLNETGESQRADSRKGAAEESKTDVAQSSSDKVSLSGTSKDLKIAEEAITKTEDVRQEKVDQIKQAVTSGQYTVNAEKVAEKMIGTLISDMV